MKEIVQTLSPEVQESEIHENLEQIASDVGKMSVLEALAVEAPDDLTPSMTWQSAWSGKDDR